MKQLTLNQARRRAKLYRIISWVLRLLPLPLIIFGGLKYFSWYFYFASTSSSPLRQLYILPLRLIQYIYGKTSFLSFFWNLPPNPNPNNFHIFNYYYWLFVYFIAFYISTVFTQRYKNLAKRIKKVEQGSEENSWKQELSGAKQAYANPRLLISINIKDKNDFIGILLTILLGVVIAIISRIVLLSLGLVR